MLHGLPMQKVESVKHLTYHNRLLFVKSWIDPKASVLLFVRFDPPTGRFPILIKGRFASNLFLSDLRRWPGKVESKINLPMQKFESVKHLTYHNRLRFVKSWIDPKASVLLFVRFDPPTGRFQILIKGRFALNLFLSDPQKWPGKVESKINLPKIIGRGRTSYFHGSFI